MNEAVRQAYKDARMGAVVVLDPALATRMRGVEMSGIRKMFELAGSNSVNMGLGEPDFPPPPHVVEALGQAARDGHNNYGPSLGIPQLRDAIAQRCQQYDSDITAKNVIVTASATQALMSFNLTFTDRGGEVIIPDPGFVLYGSHAKLCGAKPVPYTLRQENGFEPNVDEIQELINGKTQSLIINTPSNPTGGTISKETMRAISELAHDHRIQLISDEVYDTMVFDGEHESVLQHSDEAVYVNSFSKSYCMTGWRLGFIVAPAHVVKKLEVVHYYTIACPPSPIQHAALAALQGPQEYLSEVREVFRSRRDLIVDRLKDMRGFHINKPKGAFYAMPSYDFNVPSVDLALELARNDLICSPGSTFGKAGEGHLRFSYATKESEIERGMDILEKVTEKMHLRN